MNQSKIMKMTKEQCLSQLQSFENVLGKAKYSADKKFAEEKIAFWKSEIESIIEIPTAEFQSPYATAAMKEGNVGLAYELEDDWTEDGQISNAQAWKNHHRRFFREAFSEEFGLGFREG